MGGDNAWQIIERKIEEAIEKKHESRKILAMLAREEDALLQDMRELARSQASGEPQEQKAPPDGFHCPAVAAATAEASVTESASARREETMAETTTTCAMDGMASSAPEVADGRRASDSQEEGIRISTVADLKGSTPLDERRDSSDTMADLRKMVTCSSIRLSISQKGTISCMREIAERLLRSRFFEPVMGFMILINAFNIGWTIDKELSGEDTSVHAVVEGTLLGIFIAELVLRLFVHGFTCIKQLWNLFDLIIVSLTVISILIDALFDIDASSRPTSSAPTVQVMQQMLILRVLRLLRLARALRLMASCRSLWKLVQGLQQCFPTMVSALTLMALTTFFFACFGAEFITKVFRDDPEVGHLVETHFSSMPKISMTLVQFISMDSIAGFYVPLINRSPILAVYFGLLLMWVSIAMMNLVTALLVEDAISMTKMDSEMLQHFRRQRLQALKPALANLFRSLDTSDDGHIQIKEMVQAIKAGVAVPEQIQELVTPARMLDLFDAIDVDKSGDLTEDEFVGGLFCVAISDVPLETLQILHLTRSTRREMLGLRREMNKLHSMDTANGWKELTSSRAVGSTAVEVQDPSEGVSEVSL